MEQYIKIMIDSLTEKMAVLEELKALLERQEEALKLPNFNLQQFDQYVDEIEPMMKRLDSLDQGFESVYERTKDDLKKNKALYAKEIASMKQLIGKITDLIVEIQAKEARNKNTLNVRLMDIRKNYREGRKNSKTIYQSYHNMNGNANSIFLDQKQ